MSSVPVYGVCLGYGFKDRVLFASDFLWVRACNRYTSGCARGLQPARNCKKITSTPVLNCNKKSRPRYHKCIWRCTFNSWRPRIIPIFFPRGFHERVARPLQLMALILLQSEQFQLGCPVPHSSILERLSMQVTRFKML